MSDPFDATLPKAPTTPAKPTSLLAAQLADAGVVKSAPSTSAYTESSLTGIDKTIVHGRALLKLFLLSRSCYDLMPASGKVVVLDKDLRIKNAFEAMAEHDITSTLLWDTTLQDYIGILSVSDFIEALLHVHHSSTRSQLEAYKITEWREMTKRNQPLISISPESDLLNAMKLLVKHNIHRLPIVHQTERNDVLFIIKHSSVLWDIISKYRGEVEVLRCPIADLGIGTFGKVVTVTMGTPLITVLTLLKEQHISAVPVVDETGVVLDVYSKSDVVLLAQEKVYDTNISVREALTKRPQITPTPTCRRTDSLKAVMERLASTGVHRLICVDGKGHVDGIISLHDIFAFIITETPEQLKYEADLQVYLQQQQELMLQQQAVSPRSSPRMMNRLGTSAPMGFSKLQASPRGPGVSPRGYAGSQIPVSPLRQPSTPPQGQKQFSFAPTPGQQQTRVFLPTPIAPTLGVLAGSLPQQLGKGDPTAQRRDSLGSPQVSPLGSPQASPMASPRGMSQTSPPQSPLRVMPMSPYKGTGPS